MTDPNKERIHEQRVGKCYIKATIKTKFDLKRAEVNTVRWKGKDKKNTLLRRGWERNNSDANIRKERHIKH